MYGRTDGRIKIHPCVLQNADAKVFHCSTAITASAPCRTGSAHPHPPKMAMYPVFGSGDFEMTTDEKSMNEHQYWHKCIFTGTK